MVGEEEKLPGWWQEYVLKTGETIQHIPEMLKVSEDRANQLAKVMNDTLVTHNLNTGKLVEALGVNTKVIGDQVEAIRLHTATTDACLKEVKETTGTTMKWFMDTLKWVIVVVVGGLVILAGGGAIFKFFGG